MDWRIERPDFRPWNKSKNLPTSANTPSSDCNSQRIERNGAVFVEHFVYAIVCVTAGIFRFLRYLSHLYSTCFL